MSAHLAVGVVTADERAQQRVALDPAVIAQYAEAMADGAAFPAIVVFEQRASTGSVYWLADGFYRLAATKHAGLHMIEAEIRQGGLRDAILFSVGANAKHGLPRSVPDRRRAVRTLVEDADWSTWSDNRLAKACAVSIDLVQSVRREISLSETYSEPPVPAAPPVPEEVRERFEQIRAEGGQPRLYNNRHGSVQVMDTAAIGKKPDRPSLVERIGRGIWLCRDAEAMLADTALDNEIYKKTIAPLQPNDQVAAIRRDLAFERRKVKTAARDAREAALAEKIESVSRELDALPEFGVIYADPPWRFEPYSRESGMDRAADNHYPTMPVEVIRALAVPAAEDCVAFIWATAPMLPQALDVLGSWGFEYKSHLIWAKDRVGTGYWARNRHELLLIGTRGSIPAPAPGTQPESIISGPVAGHSVKPDAFYELIERLYPNIPKLEMFARRGRDGWTAWGAEAPILDVIQGGRSAGAEAS